MPCCVDFCALCSERSCQSLRVGHARSCWQNWLERFLSMCEWTCCKLAISAPNGLSRQMQICNMSSCFFTVADTFLGRWRSTSCCVSRWLGRPGCAYSSRNIGWRQKIPSRPRWRMPSQPIAGCWRRDSDPQTSSSPGIRQVVGLALATTLALRDADEALPAAVVCLSPWADLTLSGESYQVKARTDPILTARKLRHWASIYTDEENLSNPLVSPVYADFHGFPPLLIQVGSEEIMSDDATQVAEKAKAAGVDVTLEVWPGMWHVWHATGTWLPEAREALTEIGQFVREHF